jgi:acetate kinase
MTLVALNAGSSSLKYAVFADEERMDGSDVVLRGVFDRIGTGGLADHAAAVRSVLGELERRGIARPRAVAHRLVHGGPEHGEPTIVDDALIAGLERAIPFAPLHLPVELRAIAAVRAWFGDVPQVACFDTGFHRTLPTHGSKSGSGATGSTAFRSSTSRHRSRRRSCAGPSLRISATAPAWSPYATAGRSTRRWA